jgi:uncharacterized membrane protein YdbT with pleckstrin-like domain
MNPEPTETTVWQGTPSQWTNLGTYLFCALLAAGVIYAKVVYTGQGSEYVLVALTIPALWALTRWIGTRTHHYEITTERIKLTEGLLSKRTSELELYRIRDYSVVEPFWLRLVGCGNIILVSADRTSPQIILHAVPHAATLKDQIRTNTERMRQRRGVRDLEIDPPSGDPGMPS